MIKSVSLCIAVFLLSASQVSGIDEWALWFQPWWLNQAHSITEMPDECFLVGGGHSILKLTRDGNYVWKWDYQWISFSTDTQPTVDGGAIAVGDTGYKYPDDIKLVKVSGTGLLEWNMVMDAWESLSGTSICQMPDNGFILAGYVRTEFPFRDYDLLLVKLSSSGTIEWVRRWDRSEHDEPFCVEPTHDSGAIVCGRTGYRYEKRRDMWILKLDAAGMIEWQKLYGGPKREEAHSIQQAQDGGYIVAGWESSFAGPDGALVLKLDAFGEIEWQKSYKTSDKPLHAACIHPDPSGGYILTGGGWEQNSLPWYMKISALGDPEWSTRFTGRVGAGVWITPVGSGGYAAAGWREGEEWINDRWLTFEKPLLLRLGVDGKIGACDFFQEQKITALETDLRPQPTSVQTRIVDISPAEEEVTQVSARAEREVLCGGANIHDLDPPLPVSAQMLENRSLLYREYLNEIVWDVNPKNEEKAIRAYRIFEDTGSGWAQICEVPSSTFRFLHRHVHSNQDYIYYIVAVDELGAVSYPDLIKVAKLED